MKNRLVLLFLMSLFASANSFAEEAVEGQGAATQSAQTEVSSGESDCGS